MPERKIPEIKQKTVKEVAQLIKENDTFLLASTRGLQSGQFQEIRKKMRGIAEIKVAKKNLVLKAIEIEGTEIQKIKPYVIDNTALIFSKLDPFQLAALLSENKSPAKARIGQIAEADIAIEPGPTELVPGPAISELQSLGLKIAIEEGKIHIKEGKVIVRAGEPVKEAAASLMNKLNIQPFSIGFETIAAYSHTEKKIYAGIKIDKKKTLEDLKQVYGKALAFAVSIAYASKDTVKYLFMKAASHEKALLRFIKTEGAAQSAPEATPLAV